MFVFAIITSVLAGFLAVDAIPVVFKESTPNGESIVSISSSDPDVEKYWTQQLATRSGFTRIDDAANDYAFQKPSGSPQGVVHSSYSVAGPGKAIASAGRGFASASSGPFLPIFSFPIIPEGFGFNDFGFKNWMRNVENVYDPNFPSSGNAAASATAISDNGHVYGKVNTVTYDNKTKKNVARSSTFDNKYGNRQ